METTDQESVHRTVSGPDLVLPHLHRALYSKDMQVRAVVLNLRHRGVQEMGTGQGIVPDRLENPPLQPLGRQRVRSSALNLVILLPGAEVRDALHKELVPENEPRGDEIQDGRHKREHRGEPEYQLLVSREVIHSDPGLKRYHQDGGKHGCAHLEDTRVESEHRQQLKDGDQNQKDKVRGVLNVGQLDGMNSAGT